MFMKDASDMGIAPYSVVEMFYCDPFDICDEWKEIPFFDGIKKIDAILEEANK